MVEVGIPCAKGMFEAGMVGMEGFWGATGSLGNLARAASISSLLIIAFVAALTCLGAIRILYFATPNHCLSSPSDSGTSCSLLAAAVGVCRFFHKLGKGARVQDESDDHTDSQHRLSRHTSSPEAWHMQPAQKALGLP